jgi:FkbM family methyltransferase
MITGNLVLFNQATSILRSFGLRETLRRVFYYSALKIFGEELYQKPIIDCIIKHAKGYSTFIDIGAASGVITVAVSHLFNCCIAIEPLSKNFSKLLSNISANKIKNCIALPIALNEKPGTKTIYFTPRSTDTASFIKSLIPYESLRSERVKVDTLDNVIKIYGAKQPYLIKIDVQGYEYKVFKGGSETLRKKCLIISEFWPFGLKSAGNDPFEYIKFMNEFGYRVYNLSGSPLSISKIVQLCKLGVQDPFVVLDILFCKKDYNIE